MSQRGRELRFVRKVIIIGNIQQKEKKYRKIKSYILTEPNRTSIAAVLVPILWNRTSGHCIWPAYVCLVSVAYAYLRTSIL